MAKVMMTIRSPQSVPTLEEIKTRYNLSPDEIDEAFGVVEIDPEDHAYTILVEPGAAPKITPTKNLDISGPFSNPKIETFGPPES